MKIVWNFQGINNTEINRNQNVNASTALQYTINNAVELLRWNTQNYIFLTSSKVYTKFKVHHKCTFHWLRLTLHELAEVIDLTKLLDTDCTIFWLMHQKFLLRLLKLLLRRVSEDCHWTTKVIGWCNCLPSTMQGLIKNRLALWRKSARKMEKWVFVWH